MGGVGTGWAGAVAGIGNWTNAQGNVAGNTLVSSVTLMMETMWSMALAP